MLALEATNEAQAKTEAVALSIAHKGMYVEVFACFGLFAALHKRLNVFAPSDSIFGWYALNGQVKAFTNAQQIAMQNATPSMS